jgi:hypothetical protein
MLYGKICSELGALVEQDELHVANFDWIDALRLLWAEIDEVVPKGPCTLGW